MAKKHTGNKWYSLYLDPGLFGSDIGKQKICQELEEQMYGWKPIIAINIPKEVSGRKESDQQWSPEKKGEPERWE